MIRKVVYNNGKRYLVTAAGDDEGVGSGAPPGVLWMQSTDGNWYAVSLTGTSASAALSINQTPLNYGPGTPNFATNDLGYQLVGSTNYVYQVYLTGNAGSVSLVVSSSIYPISASNFKPFLNLISTDGYFYQASVTGSSPNLIINQNSKTYNPTPYG